MQRVTSRTILETPVNITLHRWYLRKSSVEDMHPQKPVILQYHICIIACPKSLFINNRKKNNSEVYGAVLPFRLGCLKKVYCLKLLLYHWTCLWIFESLKLLFKNRMRPCNDLDKSKHWSLTPDSGTYMLIIVQLRYISWTVFIFRYTWRFQLAKKNIRWTREDLRDLPSQNLGQQNTFKSKENIINM